MTQQTISVHILYFAHFSDLAGCERESLTIPAGSTIGDLAGILAGRDRRLSDLIGYGRASVNAEWSTKETELHDDDEVAFMPPMSGG